MPSLYQIIKQLQDTKGSLAKKAILEANKDNVELQDYLRTVYEPTENFYISKLPVEAVHGVYDASEAYLASFQPTLKALSERTLSGNAAKVGIVKQARSLTKEGVELFRLAIQRDIKAGVGPKTINKTWPGLITIVPYQRCVLPKDSSITEWAWGQPGFVAYSQIKSDGMYANVDFNYQAHNTKISSRSGTVFPVCPQLVALRQEATEIAQAYGNMTGNKSVQLQGELLVRIDGKILAREIGNGMLNSLVQAGDSLPDNAEVIMDVWDIIPLEEAVSDGLYNVPYKQRLRTLKACMTFSSKYIGLSETIEITQYAEAMAHFTDALARNLEGTIIKHGDAPWMDGDNAMQVKGKLEFVVDLQIVGYNEADPTGKHVDTFGSLQCGTSCDKLVVGVSGISDNLRKEIHDNREHYLGKIVSVKANGIMFAVPKNGREIVDEKHSLFLTRLVEIRLDKHEADSFNDVVAACEAAKKSATL